jgi:putative endonuclease
VDNREAGQLGERHARRFLEARGLRFRAANVRSPFGEIDLVMEDRTRGELVFVEVKTRGSRNFGDPELAVSARKRAKLRNLIEWYCARFRWNGQVRLDVVGIVLHEGREPEITHTEYVG